MNKILLSIEKKIRKIKQKEDNSLFAISMFINKFDFKKMVDSKFTKKEDILFNIVINDVLNLEDTELKEEYNTEIRKIQESICNIIELSYVQRVGGN